jgi:hypothetical protein
LVLLQLGVACVEQADGLDASAGPNSAMNCVPQRAETMKVAFILRPPSIHPPRISCREYDPPPPPSMFGGVYEISEAQQASMGPGYWPPPSPGPSPPPPLIARGMTFRSSDECRVGALAQVVEMATDGSSVTALVEIRPVQWVAGTVYILGISGSDLDLGPTTHATVQRWSVDSTGRLVLFSFAVDAEVPSPATLQVTLKGRGIHVATLSCTIVNKVSQPSPPPLNTFSLAEDIRAALRTARSEDWLNVSLTDKVFVSVAAVIMLLILSRHYYRQRGREIFGDVQRLPTSEIAFSKQRGRSLSPDACGLDLYGDTEPT